MKGKLIQEILTAISEDFTSEQLANDTFMRIELKCLMGLRDYEIDIFLPAARKIKALRGDILPLWAQGLKNN